jgi:tRNA(His) guanylyltransferase
MSKDSLGDRMKSYYEDRTRFSLTRRTHTVIRVDGKAFHTFTKSFERPFDERLAWAMDYACQKMCENIQGAKFGFVQSDEISILLTDYDELQTDAWFDYNLQKMCSVAASLATAYFNEAMAMLNQQGDLGKSAKPAFFDARVFQIPFSEEVVNYFIWRQQDASRNSVSMAAQAHFSHKTLHGKTASEMQDMLMLEKGVNWNDYSVRFKRGGGCMKVLRTMPKVLPDGHTISFERAAWTMVDVPVFTKDRGFILGLLPENELSDVSPCAAQ